MSDTALTTGNFDYSGLDPEARIVAGEWEIRAGELVFTNGGSND